MVSETYPAQAGVSRWTWRNPSPIGTDLRGAVRVDEKWWIVGSSGAFLTLDAKGTFSRVDFPTNQHLTGISYANGRFVVAATYLDNASGEDIGPIWTSTDGYSWTLSTDANLAGRNLNFVTYAADKWLVGSVGSAILTSADGVTWTPQSSGLSTPLYGGAYGDGTWVIVGASGRILSSPDTVRWTARTSGVTTDLNGVAYNNGVFVAVGASGVILRSTDGTTWTRPTSAVTTALNGVGVVGDSFVIAGDTGVTLVSSDGNTWTRATMDGKFSSSLAVASSGDNAILLGRAGEIFTTNAPTTWRRQTTGTSEALRSIVYAGQRFVLVGSRTDPITNTTVVPVSVSPDGVRWTRANGSTALNAANLTAVTYAQNTYVAVGDGGRIFTSANGSDWAAQTSGATITFSAVAGGASGFVAAGTGGTIVSSPDGATWAARTSGTTNTLNSAAYGNGRFVAVGASGTIVSSPDGVTWSTVDSGVTVTLNTVGWFENIGFLAGGNSGVMLSSADGLSWQQVETGITSFINTIAQTPVGILAGAGTLGTTLISLDGSSWTRTTSPYDRQQNGMAASPSTVVLVGNNGSMLSFDFTDATPPPVIAAAPGPQLILAGGNATFSVGAQNAFGAVYQWLKDGQPIPGANRPNYSVAGATAADLGRYAVTITSPSGSITSGTAELAFASPDQAGHLVNLSIRSALTSATDSFTFGFVVGGANTVGSKALLVRAVGPSLAPFGVTNTLVDPKLAFFTGATPAGTNDNWGGAVATSELIAQVGAFPFASPNSLDAALSLPNLASGSNSAIISGTGSGAVLAELYDATPSSAYTAATPRLVNVSVLKGLGTGITAGFVIGGATPRKVLVRAIGPTLSGAPFNVAGAVADPQLALYSGVNQIAANDNWGGTTVLADAFAQVSAFPLANGSRDAALLAELPPGAYTVQVSGVANTTGVALIEIYEVP